MQDGDLEQGSSQTTRSQVCDKHNWALLVVHVGPVCATAAPSDVVSPRP